MKKIIPLIIFITFLTINAQNIDSLITEGNTSKVLNIIKDSLNKTTNPLYYYYAGKISLSADSASYYYRRALELNPLFERADSALYLLSQIKYISGYYNTAIKYLNQFINIYSNSKIIDNAKFLLARSYLAIKDYDNCIKILEKLKKSKSINNIYLHFDLAEAYMGIEKYEEAFNILINIFNQNQNLLDKDYLLKKIYYCAQNSKNPDIMKKYKQLEAQLDKQIIVEEQNEKFEINEQNKNNLFYCQVGGFKIKNNAINLKKSLQESGYNVIIDDIINQNNKIYRVLVGPFNKRWDAYQTGKKLKLEEGLDFFIITK